MVNVAMQTSNRNKKFFFNVTFATFLLAVSVYLFKAREIQGPSKQIKVAQSADSFNKELGSRKVKKFAIVKPNIVLSASQMQYQSRLERYFGDSELGRVAQYTLTPKAKYCRIQSQCPFDLLQVYSYIGQQMPIDGNEEKYAKFLNKIEASDLSISDKRMLFEDLLPRFVASKQSQSSFFVKNGMQSIDPKAILIQVAVKKYLQQSPELEQAMSFIVRTLGDNKDQYIIQSAISLLLSKYPDQVPTIYNYFTSSGLTFS